MHCSTSLISPTQLAARQSDENLVMLDASWYLPTDGRDPGAEYVTSHIPGAHFFDIDVVVTPRILVRICCQQHRCLLSTPERWVLVQTRMW